MVLPVHGLLLLSIHAVAGTTTYTFTPAAGQCATTTYNGYCDHCTGHSNIYADRSTVSEQYCYLHCRQHPIMALLVPGLLQLSILLLPVPLLIHLLRLLVSVLQLHSYNEYCDHYTGHSNIYRNRSTVSEQYCTNALPTTSNNGITGTWTPATINTAVAGTTTYTFTPAAGQCATTATMDIVNHYTGHSNIYAIWSTVSEQYCYLHYQRLPIMVLPVHGVLQLSILLLPVPLLIHLHQLLVSVLQLLQ